MATVNFSVPDSIKDEFNAAFEGKNKSAVIAELMREAVDRDLRRQRSRAVIRRILSRCAQAPQRSAARLRAAREKGRP